MQLLSKHLFISIRNNSKQVIEFPFSMKICSRKYSCKNILVKKIQFDCRKNLKDFLSMLMNLNKFDIVYLIVHLFHLMYWSSSLNIRFQIKKFIRTTCQFCLQHISKTAFLWLTFQEFSWFYLHRQSPSQFIQLLLI